MLHTDDFDKYNALFRFLFLVKRVQARARVRAIVARAGARAGCIAEDMARADEHAENVEGGAGCA